MTKPSSRSSAARALFRAAPLALMLLAAFGLFVSGCGDDSPTTPAPTPSPPPAPPAPEPPAVPTGLQVASTGPDYIEWSWTAVEGATGYDIQMSLTAGDFTTNVQLTQVEAGTTSRRFTVDAETTAYARVRAKNADGESDWSAAVSGTSMAAPIVLTAPANLRVLDDRTTPRSITWAWNVVVGASAYEAQMSLGDANFSSVDGSASPLATAAPEVTFTVQPEQVAFVRVRAVAGTGAARMEGPWALAVRGESEQLPLTAPGGLAVSGKSDDYLEWSWNAVEGATSYDAQISLDDDNFSPPSGTFNGLTRRTHRVSNLDASDVVFLRVRAVVGTRQSSWSAAVRGQTDPPPVVPLTTPANLAASNPGRNSINLDWNDVTNANHYEVEQRAAGGSFVDATCRATQDNEPATSACVATGLAAGTEYGFRVRAIPADDEDLQEESAWSSTVTASTTGRQSVGGGAGALNPTWRSNATSITWRWDQSGLADFERMVLVGVQDRDRPCDTRGVTPVRELGTSYTEGGLNTSDTRVLCVRTVTTDDAGEQTKGEWSHSWGVTAPTPPNAPTTPASSDLRWVRFEEVLGETSTGVREIGGVTNVLRWTVDYSNQPEFDYEFRFHVDETEKTNDNWKLPDPTDSATDRAAQRRCKSMPVSDTITPGGQTAPTTFESRMDLEPYARYRMCYRAVNDDGFSDWAFNFGDGRWTRPLRPTVTNGNVERTDSTGVRNSGTTHFRLTWNVRTSSNGPGIDTSDSLIAADYRFKVVHTTGTTQGTAADPDDVLRECDGRNSPSNLTSVAVTNDEIREPTTAATSLEIWKIFSNTSVNRHYYLCAQTLDDRGLTQGGGYSTWAASPGRSYRTPS